MTPSSIEHPRDAAELRRRRAFERRRRWRAWLRPKISHQDASATVNTSHAMAAAYCHVSAVRLHGVSASRAAATSAVAAVRASASSCAIETNPTS